MSDITNLGDTKNLSRDDLLKELSFVKTRLVALKNKLEADYAFMKLVMEEYEDMIEFLEDTDSASSYRDYRCCNLERGHDPLLVLGELEVDDEEI